jgi:hypothetical protein
MKSLWILIVAAIVIWLYVRQKQAQAAQTGSPTLPVLQGNDPSVSVPEPVNPTQVQPITVRVNVLPTDVNDPQSICDWLRQKYPWIIGVM